MELLGRNRSWRRMLTLVDAMLAEKDTIGTVRETAQKEVTLA